MSRKGVIEKLKAFKNLLIKWNSVQMTEKESSELRTQINKSKPFVQEMVNRAGASKRFDWSPPPAVGGFAMTGINPFDVIFNPPYRTDVISIINDSIDEAIGIIENLDTFAVLDSQDEKKDSKSMKKDSKKVFIVHGHDKELKESVARFLEKIGLEPIILNEQVNGGLTIIEKFEKNSDVQFAIVLMTSDDLGNSKQNIKTLNPRARQNVILELGYFLGKLGRNNVCALIKGDLERPSDYDGVVYVNVDQYDGWKLLLTKELKQAKLDFDSNKVF
ncbi:nucleotide-binding protein [Flavobacterium sp.]|uniref:nucleotide-binding protein n=1 Tax=Flavobacterium sp. TaxID=239 RepID=UPI00262F9330|nr:nucleotide-binding protein [Flavobacterium sp.]